jgi:hypothetical protein
MITLSNSYHNTEITTRFSQDEVDRRRDACNNPDYRGDDRAAVLAWGRRIKNALCGSDDCDCGNVIGERV